MMKKIIKSLFVTVLCVATLGTTCLAADSGYAEIESVEASTRSENEGVIVDKVYFTISSDGEVKFYDEEVRLSRGSDPVVGTYVYKYHGKDSKKQPKYSVTMSLISETKLKKSVLSTKAEGVTSWHDNSVTQTSHLNKWLCTLKIQ